MYELTLDGLHPLSSAAYDPETGELQLEFSYDALLQSSGFFGNGRHIDAVAIDGKAYEIEIHSADGPRDSDGRYIYSRDTMENQFTIDIGTGYDPADGTLNFELTDRADGRNPLYSFELVSTDIEEPEVPEVDPPVVAPPVVQPPVEEPPIEEPPVSAPVLSASDFRILLADADSDAVIAEVSSGDELDPALFTSENLTLIVETDADFSGSIALSLDGGPSKVESVAPFALFGDGSNGDLFGGTSLDAGAHSLGLVVYSGGQGSGDVLFANVVSFTVADEAAPVEPPVVVEPEPEPEVPPVTVDPEPVAPVASPGFEGTEDKDKFYGTASDDVMLGQGGEDLLSGKDGDDYLDGGAGADRLFGRLGNDTIIYDVEDERVDGGEGLDIFVFSSGAYDIRDASIRSLETFDLTSDGGTDLTLSHKAVFQARDGALMIAADETDTIRLETPFDVSVTGQETVDGNTFDVYQIGSGGWARDVWVDTDAIVEMV